MRPAIARLAAECSVAGAVSNRLEGIQIDIEGAAERVDLFQRRLLQSLPGAAQVGVIEAVGIPATGLSEFRIEEVPRAGLVRTQVPQDLAVCQECLTEVADAGNRRANYPFTSCTDCGPRYSIVDAMPYERSRTRMAPFVLCPVCQAEYANSVDRRFHAQSNACPDCGPQ
ncbi:MAG TPA: acylphosphatase, partial [Planctomycetaceae bacterium]|nr:acylphosphatase [Planctomycetaceae bacterium]